MESQTRTEVYSATRAAYSASRSSIAAMTWNSVSMSLVASVGCTAMQGPYRLSTPVVHSPERRSRHPRVLHVTPYLGSCFVACTTMPATIPRTTALRAGLPPLCASARSDGVGAPS